MSLKAILTTAAVTFGLALVVSVLVSLLWSFLRHGAASADWETAFRLAIILAIVVPWVEARASRR